MEDLLTVSAIAAMGATLLVLYTRLRGAILDRDLGIKSKD